jgi:hypothetical protein
VWGASAPHIEGAKATEMALTAEDYARAAFNLGVDVPAIKAVIEVEAAGSGFLANGKPKILFEAHVFHRLTHGKYSAAKDRHGVALSVSKWDRKLYGAAGNHQHERLEDAAKLDWGAAHRATSWGAGQVMGSNHVVAGHPTIESFVDAMTNGGEAAHLDAMVSFIKENKLDAPLRRHDWAAFARGYNGPGYAQNQYDKKLLLAYGKYSK